MRYNEYEMQIIEFDENEVFALNEGSVEDGDSYDSIPGGGGKFSDI